MEEQDSTLRRRDELPRRSPDADADGIPATLAPPDLFGEVPSPTRGSPAHDAPEAADVPEPPVPPSADRPPRAPGGEIWVSATEGEGEGEIGLEGLGDDEGVLPG